MPTWEDSWSPRVPYFWGASPPSSSSSPGPSTFIDFIGKRGQSYGRDGLSCDLSKASLPVAPTPLPAPDSGLALFQVAVGRGTQNYTCDTSNTTAVPEAIGAVASLYNVSCIAASVPSLLEKIPPIALDLPSPSTDISTSSTSDGNDDSNAAANADLSGHHYFLNPSTPFFNLDTSTHSYGAGAFKKMDSTAAPDDAPKGPKGKGDGAVAWLKLVAKDSSSNEDGGNGKVLREVYRVNTAGGNPPKSCTGMPASFEVEYSAEYWIYEKA
ncbi:hypothetical protein AAFC00_000217 [Neodothiora populina]